MKNIDKDIERLLEELERELAIFNARLWVEVGIEDQNTPWPIVDYHRVKNNRKEV